MSGPLAGGIGRCRRRSCDSDGGGPEDGRWNSNRESGLGNPRVGAAPGAADEVAVAVILSVTGVT
jgi:hypothetical protein